MADQKKNKGLTKEDIDRLMEKAPVSGFFANSARELKSGVASLLGGDRPNASNDLSSTSEWAKANSATVSTGPSSGAPTIKPDTDLSSTSSWGKSNKATVTTGAGSGAPTISAAEASLYKMDDQQKDLDKRRSVLRQSYAQGKYDLGTKEGRDNYRRDTMFTGFGSWKGQKSPMALLRRADRELKRGNKAQAQHWLDMHDELYGNKARDKRMALDLEALDEEQKRLDKRREEANRSILAQKDEDLANKKFALQKEAAEREKDYQEWTKEFRKAEFGRDQRQFAARLNASMAQEREDRQERRDRYNAEQKAKSESQQRESEDALVKTLLGRASDINDSVTSARKELLEWSKLRSSALQSNNEEDAKLAAAQVSSITKRLEELEKARRAMESLSAFEESIQRLPREQKEKLRSAYYRKTQSSQSSQE